ncbi:hypothetical protein [Pedobacter namyangjuensis]|uniref:hypothetical protein n=1 Tax=Pedobacter namyangjuensis TaxID=600626 RepID=UPI0013B40CA2|nr:hypothetical protein [Pedobacter namyangjuensis]
MNILRASKRILASFLALILFVTIVVQGFHSHHQIAEKDNSAKTHYALDVEKCFLCDFQHHQQKEFFLNSPPNLVFVNELNSCVRTYFAFELVETLIRQSSDRGPPAVNSFHNF